MVKLWIVIGQLEEHVYTLRTQKEVIKKNHLKTTVLSSSAKIVCIHGMYDSHINIKTKIFLYRNIRVGLTDM